jgi:hypothetical protein
MNDTPQTPGVQLALFADNTCMYTTERKEGYVLRKLQRGLTSMEAWCEHWNIKINEDKTQAICLSHRRAPVRTHLTFKERNIPFVKKVKYLSVIFYGRVTWRQHIDLIITKDLRTLIRIYLLLKSERLKLQAQTNPL